MIKTKSFWVAAAGLFFGGIWISISVGHFPVVWADVFRDSISRVIITDIRLPRTLLALFVGATLALSGASMQGLLRNPLAEPGITGVTGGAVFGAVLTLYFGLSAHFSLALPIGGLIGALLAVALLFLLALKRRGIFSLILAGLAVNTFFFAAASLVLNLAENPYAVLEMVYWQMGSFANRGWDHVWLSLPFMVLGWTLLLWDGVALDRLSLGDDVARSLGVQLPRVYVRAILGTAFAVGAAVSVCGNIAFVGLLVPHILRPLAGHKPGKLLLMSAVGGAILTAYADIFVRLMPLGNEIKIGVITALLGGPFFISVLYRLKVGDES